MFNGVITDPEEARDLILTAIAYLVEVDGYSREDLERFIAGIVEDEYRED